MKKMNEVVKFENEVQNLIEYCSSFEYNIASLADFLTRVNFVDNFVKYVCDVTFDVFESKQTFDVIINNGYNYNIGEQYHNFFNTSPNNVIELQKIISDIQKNLQIYKANISKIISNFKGECEITCELLRFRDTIRRFYLGLKRI